MRTLGLVCAVTAIHLVAAASAGAQAAPVASCPGGALSIYFASGDVTASPQAQALIGKIGDTAASCHADRIDLVAHIDATVDGDRAVTVALQRLNQVAGDLVARGLPADRIRLAARSPEAGEIVAGPNQINVLIRKAEETAAAPKPLPAPPLVRTVPSDAI